MKQLRKLSVPLLTLLLLSLALSATVWAQGLGVSHLDYVILSPTNDPGSMAVTWWDKQDRGESTVQYSTTANFAAILEANVSTAAATVTKTDSSSGYRSFAALMSGLESGATYYYRVGNEESWSGEYSFTTAATAPPEVSFIYLGDIQYSSASNAEAEYRLWGDQLRKAYQLFPQLNFAVMGGDMVENGMNASNWQMFLAQASETFSRLPMLAVPGNHESNSAATGKPELFLDILALPTNGPAGFKEEFYSYDYGNCHIVGLSSQIFANEQIAAGSMAEEDFTRIKQWLIDDLASTSATWKIVVLHHPVYPVVSDRISSAVFVEWEPVFVDAQVDLVLCGHQHIYMRSKPIKGVTYVMGNSGSKHYEPAPVSYALKMIDGVSNYQILHMDESRLTMTAYNSAGQILDSVQLTAKDRSITPIWREYDLDGDGLLTENDVALLISAIFSCAPYDSELDLNNDGKVDICDAHKLLLLCLEEEKGGLNK